MAARGVPGFPFAAGTRVTIRYRLDDGMATDALGYLLTIDDTHCVVDTKRGPATIAFDRIIAAKAVPPPPSPRPRPR